MTPTLIGRWHTRLILFVVIGLPVTLLFALHATNWDYWPPRYDLPAFQYPFYFLTAILLLGLVRKHIDVIRAKRIMGRD